VYRLFWLVMLLQWALLLVLPAVDLQPLRLPAVRQAPELLGPEPAVPRVRELEPLEPALAPGLQAVLQQGLLVAWLWVVL